MDPLAPTNMCQGKGDPFPIPVSKKEEPEITKASTTWLPIAKALRWLLCVCRDM